MFQCDFKNVAPKRDQSRFIPSTAKGFKGWGHQRDDDFAACKNKKAVVVKELRLGQAWAQYLLNFDKVVILLRDPRAVRNSRAKDWPAPQNTQRDWNPNPPGWNGSKGFPYAQSLRSLCHEHLGLRRRAANESSDKVFLIEYTQVLEDPKNVLKNLMNFAGLDLVPEVLDHVEKNVNGSCEFPDEPFSVCRSQPPKRDDKWKSQLPSALLEEVLEVPECRQIINTYYKAKPDEL